MKKVIGVILALLIPGCSNRPPVVSSQEYDKYNAVTQHNSLCEIYVKSEKRESYANCVADPSIVDTKLPYILSKATDPELCDLEVGDQRIAAAATSYAEKKHIDCYSVQEKRERIQRKQNILASDNMTLCQQWSSRTAGDLQPVVDTEIKKRGVQCEMVLLQMQQQQQFQAQMRAQAAAQAQADAAQALSNAANSWRPAPTLYTTCNTMGGMTNCTTR